MDELVPRTVSTGFWNWGSEIGFFCTVHSYESDVMRSLAVR